MPEEEQTSRWERFKNLFSGNPITELAIDIATAGSVLAMFGVGWKVVLVVIEAIKAI